MATSQFPFIGRLRLIAMARRLAVAWTASGVAFLLLLAECFIVWPPLQWAALGLTGLSFLAAWTAILGWRMPVFSLRTLVGLGIGWFLGMVIAVLLVIASFRLGHPLAWRASVQWLSFTLSLALGGLLFRALFYRRLTPVWGRAMSLLSPLLIVALILVRSLWGSF